MAKRHDSDRRRVHAAATAKAMRRVAIRRICPSCQRLNAVRTESWAGFVIETCLYCPHEAGFDPLHRPRQS